MHKLFILTLVLGFSVNAMERDPLRPCCPPLSFQQSEVVVGLAVATLAATTYFLSPNSSSQNIAAVIGVSGAGWATQAAWDLVSKRMAKRRVPHED